MTDQLLHISLGQAYGLLGAFGLFMLIITYLFARWNKASSKVENFLIGERKVNWVLGGASIAASWIWAPAVFISTLFAYESGLAGLFWFVVPNMLALAIFAVLAPTIRKKMPFGYTLPQWIRYRLESKWVHRIYLFPFFFYQLMAVTVQLYAGGNLLGVLLGIPVYQATTIMAIVILAAIPLIYSLVSGLESSVITDFFQLLLIIIAILIIVPWLVSSAGGSQAILNGLAGTKGSANIFDPGIAFSLGIVTAIGLFAGAISDQQYWQRGFAIRKGHLRKAFIFGALAFGAVPILLGLIGFIGADPNLGIALPQGADPSMIGVAAVTTLLPAWTVFLFVIMLLAALSSTLDSGMNAAATLYATDVMKYTDHERELLRKYDEGEVMTDREQLEKNLLDARRLGGGRTSMVMITILGFLVALAVIFTPKFGLQQLWWVFNTVAATVAVPTVLSLYWSRLDGRGVIWGIITAFVVGLPLFVYSNLVNKPAWIVGSAVLVVAISTFFCLAFRRKTPWQPPEVAKPMPVK